MADLFCLDGPCVQADGTSWSMILNGTLNSTSDLTDSVNDVSTHSASSSLPVNHGTVVTPAGSQVDRLHTTSSIQSIKSNDFILCYYLIYLPTIIDTQL